MEGDAGVHDSRDIPIRQLSCSPFYKDNTTPE
jgi:hypothetical protein